MISTIVADCPWQFSDKLPGPSRGAEKNYSCMSVAELHLFLSQQSFEVSPDAYLLMWRVASMQQEALDVVRAWGFVVKTEIVWEKLTKNGLPWFGMGHHLRAAHETCLVCTRERARPLRRNQRSRFSAVVGRHSEKPAAFFDIVESTFPGPYAELFARTVRPGWVQVGNKLPVPA